MKLNMAPAKRPHYIFIADMIEMWKCNILYRDVKSDILWKLKKFQSNIFKVKRG